MKDKNAFHLDIELIAKLTSLLAASDLTELRLENASSAIYLRRGAQGKVDTLTSSDDKKSPSDSLNQPQGRDTIVSPTVGRFYLASESLLNPKQVEAGALLATIHIGVLQLPVRAPKQAIVQLKAIGDGQVVEYGTALFEIGFAEQTKDFL